LAVAIMATEVVGEHLEKQDLMELELLVHKFISNLLMFSELQNSNCLYIAIVVMSNQRVKMNFIIACCQTLPVRCLVHGSVRQPDSYLYSYRLQAKCKSPFTGSNLYTAEDTLLTDSLAAWALCVGYNLAVASHTQ
jgi:hypothetical protein